MARFTHNNYHIIQYSYSRAYKLSLNLKNHNVWKSSKNILFFKYLHTIRKVKFLSQNSILTKKTTFSRSSFVVTIETEFCWTLVYLGLFSESENQWLELQNWIMSRLRAPKCTQSRISECNELPKSLQDLISEAKVVAENHSKAHFEAWNQSAWDGKRDGSSCESRSPRRRWGPSGPALPRRSQCKRNARPVRDFDWVLSKLGLNSI